MSTRPRLVERPQNLRPHVVLLGAGASRAAFPNGDTWSRSIPLMHDLVDTLDMRRIVERAGRFDSGDFESVYSELAANSKYDEIRRQVKRRVWDYFSSLDLPEIATMYDRILLSLRKGDAVFTFNWDPFLFDAYARNHGVVELPGIYFLHGNVRIGRCHTHEGQWGHRYTACPECGAPFEDVPLLYPVKNKEYPRVPYIGKTWDYAEDYFREALVLTIFGYSAPTSDAAAVDLLKSAWLERGGRKMEHVEVIDVLPEAELRERWKEFTPTGHFHARRQFSESWIARWPRRSREAVWVPMSEGIPCGVFPLSSTVDLAELQKQVRDIAKWEPAEDQRSDLSMGKRK